MPLVYAAVVPHAPLLIPTIAKGHQDLLQATRQQLALMSQECYARQVAELVILTPHGPGLPDVLTVNVADTYRGRLTEFGDVQTDLSVHGAIGSIHRLKDLAAKAEIPLMLQTLSDLDYGTVVPLYFFLQPDKPVRIIPISVGQLSVAMMLRFGTVLHEFFHHTTARLGLIASADFSRRTEESPASQKPTADERLLSTAMTKVDVSLISNIQPPTAMCGFSPVLTFLAALQPTKTQGHIDSFEAPFGVGQITASMAIPS